MQFVDRFAELDAHSLIVILRKFFALIFTEVEAIERVLQRKTMSNLKLFPGYDATSTDLVRFNLETAVSVVKQVRFLSEDSRQNSHDRPA